MRKSNTGAILNWWNALFFLLGLALATGVHLAFSGKPDSSAHAGKKAQPPWGELECTTFKLALPEEAISQDFKMAKAISPISTLLMKVRVTPQSDLDALINYWGRGKRGKTLRPFLESLVRVPEGEAVNVCDFFPAIARMRLYTFPAMGKERWSAQQECFWLGLNFFNEVPDNSALTVEQVEARLAADYAEVKTNFGFGDLVVLRTSARQIRHLCVHIADNVVFTKPAGVNAPWVLMRLGEMVKEFPSETPLEMAVYRKKEI